MKRVVVTGLGVVAPNAIGLEDFEKALKSGTSGIRFLPILDELGFGCKIGGVPPLTNEILENYFTPLQIQRITADGLRYGCIAGLMAWKHAGLIAIPKDGEADWDSGCVFGAGLPGVDVVAAGVRNVDIKKVKRLGGITIPQTMSSGISAHLGGMLGLGNQVTSNGAACSTGTEAIIAAYERIKLGKAKRMLCGACDSSSPLAWAGFDSMRVLNRSFNDTPEQASRPLSASAKGFVPGGGAGALVLECLDSAQERNAVIYGEILGGFVNSGGHRQGGSMTAPNQQAILRCISGALDSSNVKPEDVDAISGHLTATIFDPYEVDLWTKALSRTGRDFPKINSLKSMIGHCLSAAGALEAVAVVLQLKNNFLHPSINCDDLHPEVAKRITRDRIPATAEKFSGNIILSSSFGFGDVNSCLVISRFEK